MAGGGPRVGYGEPLSSPAFRVLLARQVLAICGGSVAAVAVTLIVYRRTGSPLLSSLTFAFSFLPYVVGGGLLSGMVDRIRPRRLLGLSNAAGAVLTAVLAIPGMPVPALLVVLFAMGTFGSLSSGAFAALTRASLTEVGYVPGRSLMRVGAQVAQIAGTPLGGGLVVGIGTTGTILVTAATYSVLCATVTFGVGDHPSGGSASEAGLVRDSLAGARSLLGDPVVGRLLLFNWLVSFFIVAPEALAAPYVGAHHGSPALVGWWLAALPAGTIVGDVLGVRLLGQGHQRRLMYPAAAGGCAPYLLFALHPGVAVGIALLFVGGLFGMYSLGLDGRLRDETPTSAFGRMMALNLSGLMTLQGLGFAAAGGLAQVVGSAAAIVVAGGCGIAVVALLALRPGFPKGPNVPARRQPV